MKTENVGGDRNRDQKRKLLPLLALAVGLSVPVYAFAASEAECNYCHSTCTNVFNATNAMCYAEWWGRDMNMLSQCLQESANAFQDCNYYCQRPGGPCVE